MTVEHARRLATPMPLCQSSKPIGGRLRWLEGVVRDGTLEVARIQGDAPDQIQVKCSADPSGMGVSPTDCSGARGAAQTQNQAQTSVKAVGLPSLTA